MKRLSLIALTVVAPLAVMAQWTPFNDNFATDISDPSSSYLSANGISGSTVEWTWANGTGISLNAPGSGHISDLVGSFTPETLLNSGDFISLVVNFNSPYIAQGGATAAGSLLFALDNSQGVSPLSGSPNPNVESESSSASGGPTAGYLGYLGQIQMQSSAKSSTKFYAKTGSGNNDLSYYSDVIPKSSQFTQSGTGNANLIDGDNYTLTYTITALNAGASEMQITAAIYDDTLSALEDSLTVVATNGPSTYITPTTTFNTFDIGMYTGTETGYTNNLTDISIVTNVPEPGSAVLLLGGVGMLAYVRRLRR